MVGHVVRNRLAAEAAEARKEDAAHHRAAPKKKVPDKPEPKAAEKGKDK
jgi:hypothetical protein